MDAYGRISEIFEELDAMELGSKNMIETYNQSSIASAVLLASIARKKSVGAHYRSDDDSLKGE
jgi:aspartate oxidase